MAASVSILPADFVLPSGPRVIIVRIDRDALAHFDPSISPPMTDEHTFSRILREGKHAIEHVRREVSLKLFGVDTPREETRMGWPRRGLEAPVNKDLVPGTFEYINASPTGSVGIYFKQDVLPGELRPAVVELTSEREPVDSCVRFRALKLEGQQKDWALSSVRDAEANVAARDAGEKVEATQ